GSFNLARGYCRCSGCTPTACVGTRTNCLGKEGLKRGTTRSTGVRNNTGAVCGSAAASRDFASDLPGQASTGIARLVALISPSETKLHLLLAWAQQITAQTVFLDCPVPHEHHGGRHNAISQSTRQPVEITES